MSAGAAAAARGRTASAEETEQLGASLAPLLEVGDLVALEGPLGAGKTCFVAGLARGLDVKARVRSPSFTLINEYHGRLTLVHLDLYRLESADAGRLGLEEELERGALVVEWGDKLPSDLLAESLAIRFAIVGETARAIEAQAEPGRGAARLAAWRERMPAGFLQADA